MQDIGYFLCRKYCACPSSITTTGCNSGLKIILAGLRFLGKAEENYCLVEEEALETKWLVARKLFFAPGIDEICISRLTKNHNKQLSR